MSTPSLSFHFNPSRSGHSALPTLVSLALAILLTGCGSGMSMVTPPPPTPANTSIVVLLTSTANDRLLEFHATIASIVLMDKAGNSVNLYVNPDPQGFDNANVEFMHLNGTSEPIVTASVPGGVYTSAVVKVASCSFTFVSVSASGGAVESTDAQGLCGQGTGQTTVNLASPITISGSTAALSLNLQIPQSYTLSPAGSPPPSYSFSPVFTLTPVALAPQPTTELNGKLAGIDAVVTAINPMSNSFTVQIPDGFSFNVNSNASTEFQGVAAFSTLAVGTLVNLDLTLRPDSSLLATRVEVDDLTAPMNSIGTFFVIGGQPGSFVTIPNEAEGCSFNTTGSAFCGVVFQYDANTKFGFSSQFTNILDLPFTPAFTGPGLLFGQNVAVHSPGTFNSLNLQPVSSLILSPQTLNGTVTAVSNNGSFTVYSISLALYDVFPTLQNVAGTTVVRLNNPTNVVQVYVDSNTQLLTTTSVAAGSLVRVRGLVFDDNGTLRMDCNLVRDGVAE